MAREYDLPQMAERLAIYVEGCADDLEAGTGKVTTEAEKDEHWRGLVDLSVSLRRARGLVPFGTL